jgi:DNA-directed RNA polymerase specialized sigma24 family protein
MTRLPRSDAVLLDQTAAGDRSAWEELRDRHSLSLYAQVFILVGDPAEAERVVEETFQEAWCSAGQFDLSGDVHASAWLVGLARSIVLACRTGRLAPPLGDGRRAATPPAQRVA